MRPNSFELALGVLFQSNGTVQTALRAPPMRLRTFRCGLRLRQRLQRRLAPAPWGNVLPKLLQGEHARSSNKSLSPWASATAASVRNHHNPAKPCLLSWVRSRCTRAPVHRGPAGLSKIDRLTWTHMKGSQYVLYLWGSMQICLTTFPRPARQSAGRPRSPTVALRLPIDPRLSIRARAGRFEERPPPSARLYLTATDWALYP